MQLSQLFNIMAYMDIYTIDIQCRIGNFEIARLGCLQKLITILRHILK